MIRDFLTATVILVVAGGANAQSLADRLAATKPTPEPKVEHPRPSPFKPAEPEKKPEPWKFEAWKPPAPPPQAGLG